MSLFRRHLTFANVVSCLALFIALATGGAYAANTIFSEDIVDGEVKSRDVLNETLTSGDVLNNSLRAADIGPDEVDTSEITPGAVTLDELDGSSLDELGTKTFQQNTVAGCDPTTNVHVECGTERLVVELDAPSGVMVFAEGVWFGPGAGEDVGECRIEGQDIGGSRNHIYGQSGAAHDTSGHGAAIFQTGRFAPLDPGTYEFWFICRELDADFQVDWVELNAVRLGD